MMFIELACCHRVTETEDGLHLEKNHKIISKIEAIEQLLVDKVTIENEKSGVYFVCSNIRSTIDNIIVPDPALAHRASQNRREVTHYD